MKCIQRISCEAKRELKQRQVQALSLEDLQVERSELLAQRVSRTQQRAEIEARLARLYAAKDRVAIDKAELRDIKKRVVDKRNHGGFWAGANEKWYVTYMSDEFEVALTNHLAGTDWMLDAICDKITQLENEIGDMNGFLGFISNQLNLIANEIEKWLN
jgi:archaellum component FlaC